MIELDSNIVRLCLENDRRAQMHLYNTFYKRVFNSCYYLLKDKQDAEDAMQESFIKAFSKLDQYNDEIAFEAWLVRIAVNTSIDKLRENKIDITDINEEVYYPQEDGPGELEEEIIERVEHIKQAICRIEGVNQIILSLYLIEGYDHEEIAEILKIKAATSRVRYMRAKQELIKILRDTK